jgi:beta-lactamase class C
MITLRRIAVCIFCFLSTGVEASSSAQVNQTEAIIETITPQLEKQFAQAMKVNGIPGMAIAIVSKDKVHYLKTFGVKRVGKQDKITPNTLFQIASLSKPVHATLVAILQDRGKLSVEDPVNFHLPHFSTRCKQTLKICHLMSHSTGIPNNGFNELIQAYAPRDKILTRLQTARPIGSPGQNFAYNNAMYGVVEDIVTSASGKPLDKFIKEELFIPLGMQSACLGIDAMLQAGDKAYPHVPDRRGRYVPADNYSKAYYTFKAAAGINASILDMIPFVQLYLGKPNNIVSKDALLQLTSPFVKNKNAVITSEAKKGVITDTFYGLGWQSMKFSDKKIIYHGGHLKGFRNFVGFMQDDVGIIILTNAERKHASKIAIKFFDLYLQTKRAKTS